MAYAATCDDHHSGKTGVLLPSSHRRPGEAGMRRTESVMGIVEIILIGFIGINTALGLSSIVTVSR